MDSKYIGSAIFAGIVGLSLVPAVFQIGIIVGLSYLGAMMVGFLDEDFLESPVAPIGYFIQEVLGDTLEN